MEGWRAAAPQRRGKPVTRPRAPPSCLPFCDWEPPLFWREDPSAFETGGGLARALRDLAGPMSQWRVDSPHP